MPTYDYECRDCGHNFETFQSMADNALETCPECGNDGLRRLIGGGAGIIFKGSGFYVNDVRKTDAKTKPAGSADTTAKKPDSGGESKSSESTAKSD